jgi:hypothetical protein
VQEQILTHHDPGVLARSGGKGLIPFERLQSGCGTFAVGGVEKELVLCRGMPREWRSRNWRTILLAVLRSGGNAKKKTEHGDPVSERAPTFHRELAADTNGAEAEDDVAAGGGPAEAHHGAEAGEEKNLVELVA